MIKFSTFLFMRKEAFYEADIWTAGSTHPEMKLTGLRGVGFFWGGVFWVFS